MSLANEFHNAIIKTEFYDIKVINELLDQPQEIESKDLNLLKLTKKAIKSGNANCLEISYGYSRGKILERFGRMYAKGLGLQKFTSKVREHLACNLYWDCDMVNAHPSILNNLCEIYGWPHKYLKYYCENRDLVLQEISSHFKCDFYSAKNLMLRILYGGSSDWWAFDEGILKMNYIELDFIRKFEKDIKIIGDLAYNKYTQYHEDAKKKKKNRYLSDPKKTVLSYALQDIEKELLFQIDSFMRGKGYSMDVYVFDGGMIRKKTGELEFPTDLLRECERIIKINTNYDIALKIKEMCYRFDVKNIHHNVVESNVLIDDNYAADLFIKHFKDRVVFTEDKLYVYLENKGLWSHKLVDVRAVINSTGNLLKIRQFKKDRTETLHNYSGNYLKQKILIECLKPKCQIDNYFSHSKIQTGFGKMLFDDGMWDFDNNCFIEGFDPKYTFFDKISRTRPIRDQKMIDKLNKQLFMDPFVDLDHGIRLKQEISLAAHGGHIRRKKLISSFGVSDGGKGMINHACEYTFMGYSGTFMMNNLYPDPQNSNDSTNLKWLFDKRKKRMLIANENCKFRKLSSSKLCSIVSGGDKITSRKLFTNEEDIKNYATLFTFTNEPLRWDNPNGAIKNHVPGSINFEVQFGDNPDPKNPYTKLGDSTLEINLDTRAYHDAFFYIINDEYQNLKKNGFKVVVPEGFCKPDDHNMLTIEYIINTIYDRVEPDEKGKYHKDDKVHKTDVWDAVRGYPKSTFRSNDEIKMAMQLMGLIVNDSSKTIPGDNSGKRIRGWYMGLKLKPNCDYSFRLDDDEYDPLDNLNV
jgi:hypothetical protein